MPSPPSYNATSYSHGLTSLGSALDRNKPEQKPETIRIAMTVFFAADHHFGHTNIIRYSNRPFASVEEMNETLIKNWNREVSPTDTVYHLGDVSVLRPEKTRGILDRLNGKIYLIRGNHDAAATHRLCRDRFEWIKDYHFVAFNGPVKVALCHYAMRVWDRKHHGAYHLYGHSHGSLPPPPDELSMDIGVDCCDYRPISLDQVQEVMEARRGESLSKG